MPLQCWISGLVDESRKNGSPIDTSNSVSIRNCGEALSAGFHSSGGIKGDPQRHHAAPNSITAKTSSPKWIERCAAGRKRVKPWA